ncbi:uncharacterized protein LOC130825312 isoform X1 [Amaranthus tricolor]|uniref:uncharacterized protein LOC130825312 isoform X1 n=1 Tax=Amaranthus tricolor TaxID=29722 RepID=UPI00258C4534|nr:uncharacterized protein LOC130825312 isoform X1 [Amaranthus tricolor]
MLKPKKWRAMFDDDGKVLGFQKALKSIILGGVDPSIRPEVWEFLLGCYTLSSTRENREVLRAARRERYEELTIQCQRMYSSVGTGSLAYVIGSKIMDVNAYSKDDMNREAKSEEKKDFRDSSNKFDDYYNRNNKCTDTTYTQRESSSDSYSDDVPGPEKLNSGSLIPRGQAHESQFFVESALPVTNLFEKSEESDEANESQDDGRSTKWKFRVSYERTRSFHFDNSNELNILSNGSRSETLRHSISSEIKVADGSCDGPQEQVLQQDFPMYRNNVLNKLRRCDVAERTKLYSSHHLGGESSEDKVLEWFWTLHRIVVDVVRTDRHLEFYEDPKNLARMSDILAVYAWVDPETGYCQGMSDLLSPFVVLFENDADAFWCFEMLLRRTRENFRMERQTGVMKQLQSLWHILRLTDREMFSHLSQIGAESLHFAFQMLLVLFRRELSFPEALCMWEMIWAADYDESFACCWAQNCLRPLVLQLPDALSIEKEADEITSKGGSQAKKANIQHAGSDEAVMNSLTSNHSFCGLIWAFWSCTRARTEFSAIRNKEDDLPVFCVAAIMILNRHKIIEETHSMNDLIKMFNGNVLKIRVKRCIRTAVKLRNKYFYKMISYNDPLPLNNPSN